MNRYPQPIADELSWIETGEATAEIDVGQDRSPLQVIGTPAIRESMGASCFQQAIAACHAPGVSQVVLNPDAHFGHGVPVGSVLVSPTHIYPGPVGVDIKCSMSLLQTDVPEDAIQDLRVRRALIQEIEANMAHGRRAAKGRDVDDKIGFNSAVLGADSSVLESLGIPKSWSDRCEDAYHRAPDGTSDTLANRLNKLLRERVILEFGRKSKQLGSYGGGNHFGECDIVHVEKNDAAITASNVFGLKDGCAAFMSHCGSRGLGHALAVNQFQTLQSYFRKCNIDFPSGEKELVYAEYGSREANDYLQDMALGANFATVNHMLINAIVLQAFQKILPGCTGDLVYFISHNVIRRELVNDTWMWVHRKGATRAFPAGHPELESTPYFQTGHPILLPGNCRDGSSIMVASSGAAKSAFSVNHGAGRQLTRTKAKATFKSCEVARTLLDADVISNARVYPVDEAPDAYKDFREVLRSVELAGLATSVANLKPKFVIKDND